MAFRAVQGANQRTQRIHNRTLLLEAVRRHTRISRIELSRSLGLKKSSITSIVAELVENGLLMQKEEGASTVAGGRKPVFLQINENFCCFLGVELQPNKYRAVVLDLAGTIVHREMGTISTFPGGFAGALAQIYDMLDSTVRALSAPLACVGIGIPGYLNPATGKVFRSTPLGLIDFDFNAIDNPWGVPASVENDANCCAWAELTEADPKSPKSFLAILMEYQEQNPLLRQEAGVSVGIGTVIDGDVYYGSSYSSGDFKSLFWRAGNKSQVGIPDAKLTTVKTDADTYAAFIQEILLHLSPLMSVFDPERVIFCGDAAPTMDQVREIIGTRIPDAHVSKPENVARLSVSRYQEYAVALGAAGRLLVSLAHPQRVFGGVPPGVPDWEFLMRKFGHGTQGLSGP